MMKLSTITSLILLFAVHGHASPHDPVESPLLQETIEDLRPLFQNHSSFEDIAMSNCTPTGEHVPDLASHFEPYERCILVSLKEGDIDSHTDFVTVFPEGTRVRGHFLVFMPITVGSTPRLGISN